MVSDSKVLTCGQNYNKELGRSTESDESDGTAREIEMAGEVDGEYTVSAIISPMNSNLMVIELSDSSSSEWTQLLVGGYHPLAKSRGGSLV